MTRSLESASSWLRHQDAAEEEGAVRHDGRQGAGIEHVRGSDGGEVSAPRPGTRGQEAAFGRQRRGRIETQQRIGATGGQTRDGQRRCQRHWLLVELSERIRARMNTKTPQISKTKIERDDLSAVKHVITIVIIKSAQQNSTKRDQDEDETESQTLSSAPQSGSFHWPTSS